MDLDAEFNVSFGLGEIKFVFEGIEHPPQTLI